MLAIKNWLELELIYRRIKNFNEHDKNVELVDITRSNLKPKDCINIYPIPKYKDYEVLNVRIGLTEDVH